MWEEGVCIYGTSGVCIYGTSGVPNNFPFFWPLDLLEFNGLENYTTCNLNKYS